MAEEQDKGQKTEKPTPRKIQEARKEGNYPKSTDVNSAAVLIFGILSLAFFGSSLLSAISGLFNSTYMNLHLTNVSANLTSLFMQIIIQPILIIVSAMRFRISATCSKMAMIYCSPRWSGLAST